MEYKNLPGMSLGISKLYLGTLMFGRQTGEAGNMKIAATGLNIPDSPQKRKAFPGVRDIIPGGSRFCPGPDVF